MTLADHTQLGPWSRGQSDEAICQECDWSAGPDRDRVVQFAARRHVVETRHVVDLHRTRTRQVFLADHEPNHSSVEPIPELVARSAAL